MFLNIRDKNGTKLFPGDKILIDGRGMGSVFQTNAFSIAQGNVRVRIGNQTKLEFVSQGEVEKVVE